MLMLVVKVSPENTTAELCVCAQQLSKTRLVASPAEIFVVFLSSESTYKPPCFEGSFFCFLTVLPAEPVASHWDVHLS